MSKQFNKSWWKTSKLGLCLINIGLAILIGLVILIVVFALLRKYTHHGEEVEVPDVTGMYLEEADVLLAANGLHFQVIDSTYSKKTPMGTIVEQDPPALSHAKSGRTVYVILNARSAKQVVIPELRDVSCRQAQSTLQQLGLIVDSVEYEPSEYKELVLDLKTENRSIEPGERLPEGTHITMVVGFGQGTEMVTVPDLRSYHLQDARYLLLNSRLTLGSYTYSDELTEENEQDFVIYMQQPEAGNQLLEGSRVDIFLSTDLEKTVTTNNEESEENFF